MASQTHWPGVYSGPGRPVPLAVLELVVDEYVLGSKFPHSVATIH